ncbi:hypothetical protein BCR32DRAFT_137273 [Anaeromyces robustus]|uniref:Coth-domain-containing protein n=1 Tax=Anaeromyces robustus TaxID=1754192 RepID=A0A1Y1XPN8_9FUNG|nr:hypothetical protein BCR32DRAFT_137273 [Anaeromyces robustus]|eukprot:ORX87710.1 hypothetical protein BCR32DRAFT_137273 [Anaeromyces robustus]
MKVAEFPLYKTTVNVDPPVKYFYSVDYSETNEKNKGVVQEQFERECKETETLNDFFERKITKKTHPALPKAYESYPNYSASKLFDDTHVATVIINADAKDIAYLHNDPTNEDKIVGVEFIYATPYSVRTFKNATLGISGQTTIYAAKLSYKISNLKSTKNKELYKRTGIKLRAEHMDPSYLRDKIYCDVLNSLGVPTPQNKFARVFINGDPIGLFTLSDNVSNKRYLRETLNNGSKFDIDNPLFKADYFPPTAYGDLGYYGPYDKRYDIYYYKGQDIEDIDGERFYEINTAMNNEHLIPFLKSISEYPETKSLNMNTEMFLKYMAMEFMAGAVDNYWSRPGNYYIFKNMNYNEGEWLFLDSDFHYSFGIGDENLNAYLSTTIDDYAALNDEVDPSRPLLDNLRTVPENEEYFKNVFIRLINTAFHVDAFFPRIDSLAELIREDVAWDTTLPRVSGYANAEDFKYTLDDFEKQVSSEPEGCENLPDSIPLRCWIRNRGKNIANQLNVEYPSAPDKSLGEVETLVQTNIENFATRINTGSLIVLTIISIMISYMVNF